MDPDNSQSYLRIAWRVARILILLVFVIQFYMGIVTFIMWQSDKFSRERWQKVADNAEPLITAINQYETDKGRPPGLIEQLVPKYLPRIPGTGDTLHPDFAYYYHSHPDDYGNTWTLRVRALRGHSFDEFLYFPRGVYPPDSGGNTYERIGKWSYFHE